MTRYLFIVLVIGISVAVAQQPLDFYAGIDSFGSHSYRVLLRDGKLIYEDIDSDRPPVSTYITPSPEEWRAFRSTLDKIGVWAWRASYERKETINDGTSWWLYVRYSDQHVDSRGGNCYPGASGECAGLPLRTPIFRKFEAGIEALLGGKPFHSADKTTDK